MTTPQLHHRLGHAPLPSILRQLARPPTRGRAFLRFGDHLRVPVTE